VRIGSQTAIDQTQLLSLSSQQDLSATSVRQRSAYTDTYNRNAQSASVIDAEYVDTYQDTAAAASPQRVNNTQPQLDLDQSRQQHASGVASQTQRNSQIGRYQALAADTPMPGTYLNVFA